MDEHDEAGNGERRDAPVRPSLPPPAFPPGTRRIQVRSQEHRERVDDVALIFPDDPMPKRRSLDDAFISPDDPIPHRPEDAPFLTRDEPGQDGAAAEDDFEADSTVGGGSEAAAFDDLDSDDGVVTGMGDDAHLDPEELVAGGDPYVMDLIRRVDHLAEALKRRGEAGLRSTGDMDRFEATLRAYCVGYLAGRRAEDEPSRDY